MDKSLPPKSFVLLDHNDLAVFLLVGMCWCMTVIMAMTMMVVGRNKRRK